MINERYEPRTKELAEAEAAHAEIYERLKEHAMSRDPAGQELLGPLYELRDRIRRLRPHTLRWRVALDGGASVAVETRDKSDFLSDTSTRTVIVGAFAEVPHRDSMRPKHREVEASHYEAGWRDREADHRAAVDRLAEENGWKVAAVERDGESWGPP